MATILIKRQDGTTYDLDRLGFNVKKFNVPLNNNNFTYQQIGRYGSVLTNIQNQYTTLELVIDVRANDEYDYQLQLLKLREIFKSDEFFYVINNKTPWLRWAVYAETVTPQQQGNFWQASDVTIQLECPDAYAETVKSTSETNWQVEKGEYGFEEHIPTDTVPTYKFSNQTNFDIYNLGLVPLMADDRPVVITFKGDVSDQLKITNKTSNQSLTIKKAMNSGQELKITGVVPMLGDDEIYDDGDHGYLDFATGKNEIQIEGASNFEISFNTRFYF